MQLVSIQGSVGKPAAGGRWPGSWLVLPCWPLPSSSWLAVRAHHGNYHALSISGPAGGSVEYQLVIAGEPDQDYVLEASADLQSWASISTNRTDYSGKSTPPPPLPTVTVSASKT